MTYSLAADRALKGVNKVVIPALILRCREGKLDVLVRTGMAPNPSPSAERYRATFSRLTGDLLGPQAEIRLRFDAEEASEAYWSVSTDQTAISAFKGEVAEFMDRVAAARTLRVEFTPHRSSPQVIPFSVQGLGSRLKVLRDACPVTSS